MKRILFFLVMAVSLSAMAQEQTSNVQRDDEGNILSSTHGVFDSHDRLAVLITYSYDDQGVVYTRTLQSYDNQGRPVRIEIYSADEYLLFTENIRYDRQGRRSKEVQVSYDENGIPEKNTLQYKYGKDGSLTILLNGKEITD